jgi:hypothetical protein
MQLVGVALVALGVLVDDAQAQVFVTGDAQGCFGLGCTPLDSDGVDASGVWLSYASNPTFDFQGITAGGFLAINNEGTSATGNFGLLSVGTTSAGTVINVPFTLSLGFINPTTASSVFSAVITGYIASSLSGGVVAFFNPPSVTNPFYDAFSGLSGDLTVTPLPATLPSGGTSQITGYVQVSNTVPSTVTPEPVTVVMLGSGLLGLAVARRRRKVTAE